MQATVGLQLNGVPRQIKVVPCHLKGVGLDFKGVPRHLKVVGFHSVKVMHFELSYLPRQTKVMVE